MSFPVNLVASESTIPILISTFQNIVLTPGWRRLEKADRGFLILQSILSSVRPKTWRIMVPYHYSLHLTLQTMSWIIGRATANE